MIDSLMNTAIELWMEAINWSQGLWYISNSFIESISLFGTAVITDFLSIWWHFLNFSAKTLVATMVDAILVSNSRKRFIGYHVSLLNTIVKRLYALNKMNIYSIDFRKLKPELRFLLSLSFSDEKWIKWLRVGAKNSVGRVSLNRHFFGA